MNSFCRDVNDLGLSRLNCVETIINEGIGLNRFCVLIGIG